jgi:hypothetical protein
VKWYKPIENVKADLKEPVQRIAIVAFVALIIAVSALVIVIGKGE